MSVKKTFNITLDVSSVLTNEEFRVKQGDTGNVFIVTLKDGSSPVDLSNCRVVAVFTHGDSLAMQDNWTDDGGISISGDSHNIITIDLFNGSFVPGLNECEIQVYSGDELDTLITSASFNFKCARALINEETIRSAKEYSILTSLIASVQNVITGAQSDWNETDTSDQRYIANKPAIMPPTAHASSHATGGVDAITLASIGAAPVNHATAHASGGTDAVTPASIGAAVVCAVQLTLTVAGWTGDDSPYTQQQLVNRVTADSHIILAPAVGYEEAFADCGVKLSEQGDRTLTFTCESKPDSGIVVNALIIYGNEAAYQGITTDDDDVELNNSEVLSMWNS